MQLRWCFGLAAALAAALAATSASPHGGGGGGHVVVVVVPGAAANVPLFRGDEAAILWEVAADPPTAAESDIKLGDVVALHALRAADVIVLDAAAKGRRRDVPAGTPLVRMEFTRKAVSAAVWCDIRPTGVRLWPQEHDCFEDQAGHGSLDRLWQGDSHVHFVGFSQSGVGYFNDPLAAPVAYHRAKPDERPTATLGFKYCDGDGVTGPPRFAAVLTTPADQGAWILTGQCRFGVWPDPADKTHVDVDGMQLEVAPAGAGMLHVKLLGRLPPGPIGPLASNLPVRPRGETRTLIEADAERTATERRGTMIYDIKQEVLASGPVREGEVLATLPIRHAFTGTLENRIRPGLMWRLDSPVEVGQPVFGLTGKGWGGDGIVWCAPRLKDGVYDTACLLPEGDSYFWIPHREPALLPSPAAINSLSQTGGVSSAPSVKQEPVKLPPMTIRFVLAQVRPRSASDPTLVYDVDAQVDWGEGGKSFRHLTFQLAPDGGYVNLLGVVLHLKPADNGGVEVVKSAT